MSKERVNKPFYKKWWVWLIALVVIGGIAGIGDEEGSTAPETNQSDEEKQTKDKNKKEAESNDDDKVNEEDKSKLNEEEVSYLKTELEESLKAEQDFGDMFYLDDFGYDESSNRIEARIDMQQDPLPDTPEEIKEWAETWSWSLVEATPEVDKPFLVRVTLTTKVDDGYILWGHSRYDPAKKEYSFKEEEGMKLIK